MYTQLKLNQIKPDPNQPRQEFDPAALGRLVESIRKYGVINPLIVEKQGDKYLLVDGERRYRASLQAKLDKVPVLVINTKDETDRQTRRFHLQEQHVSWSSFDKARSIERLQENTRMNIRELAESLGLSFSNVNDYLSLLQLSTRSRQLAVEKRVPFSYLAQVAHAMKKVEDVDLKKKLESSLIAKIENGEINNYKDVKKYGMAIKHGGEKVAKKVVSQKNYTVKQAMKDSKADIHYVNMRINNGSAWLTHVLREGLQTGSYKQYDPAINSRLKTLISLVKEFLTNLQDNKVED